MSDLTELIEDLEAGKKLIPPKRRHGPRKKPDLWETPETPDDDNGDDPKKTKQKHYELVKTSSGWFGIYNVDNESSRLISKDRRAAIAELELMEKNRVIWSDCHSWRDHKAAKVDE